MMAEVAVLELRPFGYEEQIAILSDSWL